MKIGELIFTIAVIAVTTKACEKIGTLNGYVRAMNEVNKKMPGTIDTLVVDIREKDIYFRFNKNEEKSTENQEEQES